MLGPYCSLHVRCVRMLAADRDGDQLISFDEFASALERSDVEQKMSIRFLNWPLLSGTHMLAIHARILRFIMFLIPFLCSFISLVSSSLLPLSVFVLINRSKLCFRVYNYKPSAASPSLCTIWHITKFHCDIKALQPVAYIPRQVVYFLMFSS